MSTDSPSHYRGKRGYTAKTTMDPKTMVAKLKPLTLDAPAVFAPFFSAVVLAVHVPCLPAKFKFGKIPKR